MPKSARKSEMLLQALRIFLCLLLSYGLLHLLASTGFIYGKLTPGLDRMTVADFKNNAMRRDGVIEFSPELRMVYFNSESRDTSYTRGAWTPREKVAHAILEAVRGGAKVVSSQFGFRDDTPVLYIQGDSFSDDSRYLLLLEEAIQAARQSGTVIILPHMTGGGGFADSYRELVKNHGDVVKTGHPAAIKDSDGKVRGFALFSRVNGNAPTLALLSWLYQRYDKSVADEFFSRCRNDGSESFGDFSFGAWLPRNLFRAFHADSLYLSYRILPRSVLKAAYKSGHSPDYNDSFWCVDGDMGDIAGKLVLIGPAYPDGESGYDTAFGFVPFVHFEANILNMLLSDMPLSSSLRSLLHQESLFLVLLAFIFISLLRARLWAYPDAFMLLHWLALGVMTVLSVFRPRNNIWHFSLWLVLISVSLYLIAESLLKGIRQLVKRFNTAPPPEST